jgi:FKBP-type peptidyl-prolyl cis-trans isomerase 2
MSNLHVVLALNHHLALGQILRFDVAIEIKRTHNLKEA